MNLNKIAKTAVLFIFLMSFITHNMYDWFPSTITFVFFPINESIFEHQKMIFTTYLLWGLVSFYFIKQNQWYRHNILFVTVIGGLINVLIFLAFYMPIYIVFGHNIIVTLIVYLGTIIFSQYLCLLFLKTHREYKIFNIVSFFLIPLLLTVFTYFSLNPVPDNPLFCISEKRNCEQ